MQNYFATISEDVRHERSIIFLLSVTYWQLLKQIGFTDSEKNE